MSEATVPLANLIIAGVGKSGTTSLFSYLSQHPDVCGSRVKETHFFSPLRTGGSLAPFDVYRDFFRHWSGEPYRLEASPDYCVGGAALRQALRDHLSDPRIIIILRDPIERLWDNYWYMKGKLQLPDVDSFEEYVARGLERRRRGGPSDVAASHSGWSRSFYGDFVGAWLDAFGDRLRLVFFDDLASDAAGTVIDLCAWLGLDPAPARGFDYRIQNPTRDFRHDRFHRTAVLVASRAKRSLDRWPGVRRELGELYARLNQQDPVRPAMAPATRVALEEAMRGSNQRLTEALVRYDYRQLPAWLGAGSVPVHAAAP